MPSRSQAQNRLMHAAAENPSVAKRTGVSESVAKDFVMADVGRKIAGLPEHVKKPKAKRR
jgi:ectoine hydroxylase-related dioxygenase (phytanoyl-CoA dioxygenase family)